MSFFTLRGVGAMVVLQLISLSQAATWYLVDPVLVHDQGTWPSVWSGELGYLHNAGGAVMYFDGVGSELVYPAALSNYEPAFANGVLAWRNCQDSAPSNEILRWSGQTVVNISNSPGIVDSDVAVGSNGDVMWSKSHQWLMYYDASTGATVDLGIRGVVPSMYVTSDGVVTYVYQCPDTFNVRYFDGTTTHTIGLGFGQGTSYNGRPKVCDGAVAWIGRGEGDSFTAGEVFFWRDGVTTRVTDDDAAGGKADDYPSLWNDVIVWQRAEISAFQTRIFLWDGTHITQITSTRSLFPSFHGGWVAWVDYAAGLKLARVIPDLDGDCNQDGVVDGDDFALIAVCFAGPDSGPLGEGCQCGDLDDDGDIDLADIAALQTLPQG